MNWINLSYDICWSTEHGTNQKNNASDRCTWHWSALRSVMVWSRQGGPGMRMSLNNVISIRKHFSMIQIYYYSLCFLFQGWGENDRGVSFTFGPDVVSKFLNRHDMDLICRAHQVVEDGYEFFAKRQLVTLFSAPNYCGEFDNAGGMMSVDETLMCSFQVLLLIRAEQRFSTIFLFISHGE